MTNKRIFIGWSGQENWEVARRISNKLSEANYSPIIGGEWRASLTVSEEIMQQMVGCDFAIILIEKEVRKNRREEVISMGFNPNVMMELGYLLHKFSDANRIRRILINMDPGELPTDLQGAWSVVVDKAEYPQGDEEAKEKALSQVADAVVRDFFSYMENDHSMPDKLDYFDNWEENVQDIYHYTGNFRIADKLIYGMQAAIYSGEYERLYKKLISIRDALIQEDRFGDYHAVVCAMSVLKVFVITHRLTRTPSVEQFQEMYDDLNSAYERNIQDPNLRAWCEIFRIDKLELCYEVYANGTTDPEEKAECYNEALRLCHQILSMIDAHLQGDGSKDEKYALLYQAFANRNISQIHKNLAILEPEKAGEHYMQEKEYCAKTLENRKLLYDYYKEGKRKDSLSMDFISQEYLLALAEQNKFEESSIAKKNNQRTVQTIFNKWREKNEIRNMIFQKVEQEISKDL